MVVDWRRRRLNDKDLFAPDRLIQMHHYFAVGEPIERTRTDLYPQLPSDGDGQTGIGATCENRKRIIHVHLVQSRQPGRACGTVEGHKSRISRGNTCSTSSISPSLMRFDITRKTARATCSESIS